MKDFMTRYGSAALAALALLVVAPGLVGAQEVDRRWLPWTGCWEVVGPGDSETVVCVGAGETTSEIVLVDGNPETQDIRIRADGQPRAVDQFGCAGTESARFSPDGSRVYTQGQYLCEDGVEQSSTGVLAMVAPDEWVDIRSLEMNGEKVAWVQRYVAGTPGARSAEGAVDVTPEQALARRMAARTPNTGDLMEVATLVDSRVAAAWLATVNADLALDGETLLAMHDAGIDPEVIDVAIAVSHPDRFVLGPEGDAGARPTAPSQTAYASGPPVSAFGSCWGASSFFLPWGPAFGCGVGFGYSPYFGFNAGWGGGWGGWGWGGWGPGYWGPVVVVPGDRPSTSSGSRAIAGRGYRGPRSSASPTGFSGSSGGVNVSPPRSQGASGGSVGRAGGSTRSTPSRSGGTRRAKPRGGGGI